MEMFEYAFMQRAFIVGVLLALIIPLIGVTVVLRRLSMPGMVFDVTLCGACPCSVTRSATPRSPASRPVCC